jgi:hypothetical protein
MTSALGLFDEYNRQARLYPALLALFPPLIAVLAWFPELLTSNLGTALMTIAGSCGVLFGLSVFSRSCGKRTEARLLKVWGGWPTTEWLRHADAHLPAPTKQRYHRALVRCVPDLRVPPPEEERTNPAAADEVYRSATEWLKEHTRGKGFPLVMKENTEYGFRRNLRGMRPFAMAAAGLGLIASLGGIGYRLFELGSFSPSVLVQNIPVGLIGAALLLLLALIGWALFVNDAWVRQAGDQYARALLAVCDTI